MQKELILNTVRFEQLVCAVINQLLQYKNAIQKIQEDFKSFTKTIKKFEEEKKMVEKIIVILFGLIGLICLGWLCWKSKTGEI